MVTVLKGIVMVDRKDYEGLTFEQLAKHATEGWDLAASLRADLVRAENSHQVALKVQGERDELLLQIEALTKNDYTGDYCNVCKQGVREKEARSDSFGVVTHTLCSIISQRDAALRLIEELQKKVTEQRKMLWWVARDAGRSLHIPKAELDSIPEGAALLVWYEKLFDSMILKELGLPTGGGKTVVEKTNPEKRNDLCPKCDWALVSHVAGRCPSPVDG